VYGVPADLDLSPFEGARLVDVVLGLAHTKFVFEPGTLSYADVNVESLWELRSADSQVINTRRRPEHGYAEPLHLHLILGERVAASHVAPPDWFEFVFGNGTRLRVYDDSTEFESFTISPGGLVVQPRSRERAHERSFTDCARTALTASAPGLCHEPAGPSCFRR